MAEQSALQELQAELRSLTQRVALLEALPGDAQQDPSDSSSATQAADVFWALTGLRERLPEHRATERGAVMLVGSVTLPGGAPVEWQQSSGTSGLFETEWDERATAFAALGHPVRLELLRHVLSGVHSTAELAAVESLGTTGQLHHHLRQLLSSGWLKQSGRGAYEVPASRIVPLLACLVAVGG